MWWLWLVSLARGACDDPVTREVFDDRLATSWALAIDGSMAEFRAEVASLQGDIDCLTTPLSVRGAAAFHRNRALVSLDAGDEDGARSAARAAGRLQPDEVEVWSGEVPALAPLWAEVAPAVRVQEFGTSLAASVFVDGVQTATRTTGQPAVVQLFGVGGVPVGGAWVDSRLPLPDWVVFPPVDCPVPVPIADLVLAADASEQAFARLDVEAFEGALQAVAEGLPCVDSPIDPAQAAAVHRLEGMRLFTRGAELGALRSFQESRLLDPSYVPSPDAVRPESTLESLWVDARSVGAPPWVSVAVPESLTLRVDGITTDERPATLPAIVQAITEGGRVLWTRYLPAATELPDLSGLAVEARVEQEQRLPPAVQLYRDEEALRARSGRREALAIGGTALVFVGGLLYQTNANLLSDFEAADTPVDELQRLRLRTNTAATLSTLSAGTGLGLIGLSFVIR